jgi:beta-glucosidase
MGIGRNLYLLPSSPLTELRKLLPEAEVEFDAGMRPAESAAMAARCDVAIVFAVTVESEGFDDTDLSLPWGQDAVIEAVAAANPRTIVVLQTGNPVVMPWRDQVAAIVEAWYPGQAGGQAIAEVLTGTVNPSGRLPVTFPADLDQTPRPELPGLGTKWGTPTTIEYNEGSEVGYRWFAKTGAQPLYAFGHGLSYTTFEYADPVVSAGDTITAEVTVTNTGDRDGVDVVQLYLTRAAGEPRMRLLAFQRVTVPAGESRQVRLEADPRLLARYDGPDGFTGHWRIDEGPHHVALARNAIESVHTAQVEMRGRTFGQ